MAKRKPKQVKNKTQDKERLQKVMASAGVDSRRKCEDLILEGAVEVNGVMVNELPAFVDPDKDEIKVSGKRLKRPERVYFLLNKPRGYICTNKDPHGRKKAIDLIDTKERLISVGRLDAETTGALILTNDTGLANLLTHPKYELSKTYEVKLRGSVEGEDLEKLKKGLWLAEGRTNRAAVKVLSRTPKDTIVEITIRQGLNRQIRRMFARVGYKVKRLKRTKIGNIEMKGLPVGAYRTLTKSQVAYLKRVTAGRKGGRKKKK
ncbi:Ribosomal large subunit pseudouridine synthase B [Anaerohalosphaera lusitana]|uniref:Pseudouridine synthase n=1 Tax=Anaerohalosphaera lusitana TaxID=1936003 RepID=A0A1U9NM03_9BACT|nr:pseudouridine synthase [Anaerohalosphaera lusitana]AQT68939.1 Ribosomal large subunit pseudouridine synthase B [Anaerohalosphaera lusitana]